MYVLNRFTLTLDDAAIDPAEANTWATYINNVVDVAKKNARPSALKQDFAQLENTPYEPVMSEISVTIGLDVNDKHHITFKLDSDHYTHGFVLGKSGSGKSALLNNIICSAIMKYSPEDLMLYLMDFKGVEFNTYRGLKHTKAVFVDANDPHMTLEVVCELYKEYERRMELFVKEGVKQIKSYNEKFPNHRLPQILFIADECQVMLKLSSTSGLMYQIQKEIIDKLIGLARLGRAGGIHLLLATQQLEGVEQPEILGNISECFLLLSAPQDSNKLVPESSNLTSTQMAGLACYYHDKNLQSQFQSFYANEEETAIVIETVQKKAMNIPGNGELYFDGSAKYWLKDKKGLIEENSLDCPIALVGQNIGMYAKATTLPLRNDFSENILIFGTNKEEQTAGVTMNVLASLMLSYQQKGIACKFLVIDCLVQQDAKYKTLLDDWKSKGLCKLIPRQESGGVLHDLIDSITNNTAIPTILVIIGQERFIEMRRKPELSLQGLSSGDTFDDFELGSFSPFTELEIDESSVIPELTEEQKLQLQKMLEAEPQTMAPQQEEEKKQVEESSLADRMTYLKALSYILDEGPLHGIHTLLMVDKPGNILFEGDLDVNDTDKFRHKIILRSENKFLQPMRFSQEIDVEILGDKADRMRAYYYPEGDDPVLFTPYQMPDEDIV